MKKLIIFFIGACSLMINACNEKRTVSNTATGDGSTIDTAETLFVAPTSNEHNDSLTGIAFIKQRVAHINSSTLISKRIDFMCDEKAYVVYHSIGSEVVKIIIDWGVVGDAYHREEFYYDDGKLIFDYDLVEGAGAYEGGDKKLERRHYVVNNKVVKYLENQSEKPCEYCDYNKSSVAYRAHEAEGKDVKAALCR